MINREAIQLTDEDKAVAFIEEGRGFLRSQGLEHYADLATDLIRGRLADRDLAEDEDV